MKGFNNGKAYHGSQDVKNGKLKGATDTDYFYFFCPKCPDEQIVRILEYGEHVKQTDPNIIQTSNEYNRQCKSNAKYGFTLAFKFFCEKCGHTDFFKISNIGRQKGQISK